MFGRFTERAQKVLFLARDEARRLGHPAVGTEHLLLGLLREGEGIAARSLKALGVDVDKVRQEVEKIVSPGKPGLGEEIGLTPRAKKVLELAQEEGRRQGVSYVGTEHILLGLIREGEGVAARVLVNQGLTLDKVRRQVLMLLGAIGPVSPGHKQAGMSQRTSQTPTMDELGRDLTELSREGKLDPVIGRDKEIERVIQILSRRTKNNPCLIGEPGVGKTAVAEGLAQRIVENKIPEIHGPALGISKPSVLHHLQQDMEDIRVCLFDLIKEHNRVRALPDSLCQLAGLLIAHISWGRSQKPGHSVLLHVFGHIEPHHGLFITEKRLC
jgi:ATP-dependent Clp protease ATP-binding subunit ClpC